MFQRFLVFGVFSLALASPCAFSQPQGYNGAVIPVNSNGVVLGDPQNAVADFKAAFGTLKVYRDAHKGQYPKNNGEIVTDMLNMPLRYGFKNFAEGRHVFTNPDFMLANLSITPQLAESVSPYKDNAYQREDGSPVGSATPMGMRDVLMWTDLYVYRNDVSFPDGGRTLNPVGTYVVLWGDGEVAKVPFDLALFAPSGGAAAPDSYDTLFPGQVNGRFDTLSYEERYKDDPTPGKPTPGAHQERVADNGGPEALLQLSRRVAAPGSYGIERDKLWQAFDPTYADFKFADLQTLSTPLGVPTQVKSMSFDELQASGVPAVIFLKTTQRFVTLSALDDNRALIIDGGKTLSVERTAIKADYSGEALVAAPAADRKAAIVASDPVRVVSLPALDAQVAQQVKLRNTGNQPVTLQLPAFILGVTDAQLSQTTLAPGESATLDLKMKWRPSLAAPTQNVLVSIATSDPANPNLQLSFLLAPPK